MTTRHLGGLIAAYDLSQDGRLLSKAREMVDLLLTAFQTENGMPCSHCDLVADPLESFLASPHIAMAEQGSVFLELVRFAQITGNVEVMKSAIRLTTAFARTQNDSTIPGLWPEIVDATSVDGPDRRFANGNFAYSIGALSDSTYEYLVKGHILLGHRTTIFETMWKSAATAIRSYLLYRPQLPEQPGRDIIFSGAAIQYPGDRHAVLEPQVEHLGCFAGGMFGLASRIFHEPDHFAIGEALTNGCVWAYQASPIGIMPEKFTAAPCSVQDGTPCGINRTSWHEGSSSCLNGTCRIEERLPLGMVAVIDARYLLGPEAIESVFYYWRLTGNEYWREVGWRMFVAIRQHTRTPYAYASVDNVMTRGEVTRRDEKDSFRLGETLKYFYLLFSSPSLISLDEYVLNTKGHPFKLGERSLGEKTSLEKGFYRITSSDRQIPSGLSISLRKNEEYLR